MQIISSVLILIHLYGLSENKRYLMRQLWSAITHRLVLQCNVSFLYTDRCK